MDEHGGILHASFSETLWEGIYARGTQRMRRAFFDLPAQFSGSTPFPKTWLDWLGHCRLAKSLLI
ncbi:MAG: hypothetical protein JF626_07505 [Polaromonas sp.]|nr:hypothetical protein [Polaromonas sp.]